MNYTTFISAPFSNDYSDFTCPVWQGYYPECEKNEPFKSPYFTKEVAELIAEEWNGYYETNQDASDRLEWEGDVLMWWDNGLLSPIHPIKSLIDGKEVDLYPIGHGSWNWECGEETE